MKSLIFVLLPFLVAFRPVTAFFRSSTSAGGTSQSFVLVKAMSPYTTQDFYVAKFEMKNIGGVAFSAPSGLPWVNITRADAVARCRALGSGYDLMTNAQWQTIARDIALTAANWSENSVGSGQLSRGHSDGLPAKSLEASKDDENGNCAGTGQNCSAAIFSDQKRTHLLSSGNVIWDFSGNVWEVVSDSNTSAVGLNAYISQFITEDNRRSRFGSPVLCAEAGLSPYCGLGYGAVNYGSGGIWRGGYWGDLDKSGTFATRLNVSSLLSSTMMGFRCVRNF